MSQMLSVLSLGPSEGWLTSRFSGDRDDKMSFGRQLKFFDEIDSIQSSERNEEAKEVQHTDKQIYFFAHLWSCLLSR